MSDIVDTEKERTRLNSEKSKLENEISRLESKLSNEGFISKAPAAVVEGERTKLLGYKEKLNGVITALSKLR